jgi:phosphate starvation-inducible protein PhoH and related proteins
LNTVHDNINFALEPQDNNRLANLCGQFDEHLRQLERRFKVKIHNRGHKFHISGEQQAVTYTVVLIHQLYGLTKDEHLNPERVNLYAQQSSIEGEMQICSPEIPEGTEVVLRTKRMGIIRGRGANQRSYLHKISQNDVNFGIGVAGSGKTYLAVACAVEALEQEKVGRIVLVRPAVEAGERLGFLPGDLAQKVDPYLRPIYDALHEMLGFERVGKLIERQIIEVAPLAYMRGRTLNNSFIILDEAQNTTAEQMKMFLTRIGFGSTAVITGDITQIDLPHHTRSGLRQAMTILQEVEGVSFTYFTTKDVVRHPIVSRIISAYEAAEAVDHTLDAIKNT